MDNTEKTKRKIYAFINSGKGTDWIIVVALAEDGQCLASHCSSSEGWAKHDIGIGSDWKHDVYNSAFPEGWELEWVDNVKGHEGIDKAYKLNQELQKSNA
jgi:hypothetical protein